MTFADVLKIVSKELGWTERQIHEGVERLRAQFPETAFQPVPKERLENFKKAAHDLLKKMDVQPKPKTVRESMTEIMRARGMPEKMVQKVLRQADMDLPGAGDR